MRGGRSQRGRSSTTRSARTAVWDTELPKSLLPRLGASTELNWGKRPQTPAPCPRPPSPLKPEMDQKKFVVFLRERKQGAGHAQEHSRAAAVYDSMPRGKKVDTAVISPDGTQVAYI